jgi:hypothetical protein
MRNDVPSSYSYTQVSQFGNGLFFIDKDMRYVFLGCGVSFESYRLNSCTGEETTSHPKNRNILLGRCCEVGIDDTVPSCRK